MTTYYDAGEDVVLTLSGPAGTNATLKLFDHDGTVLATDPITFGPNGTVDYTAIAANNAVTGDPAWERRTLKWLYAGGRGAAAYRLVQGVSHDATTDLVRTILGVNADELSDDEIDLVAAFFAFREKVDPADMDAGLIDTGSIGLKLARAIAATAAQAVLPSLQVRLALRDTSGTNEFERQEIDWQRLTEQLAGIVDEAIEAVSPTADGAGVTLFALGTRTDPITGV